MKRGAWHSVALICFGVCGAGAARASSPAFWELSTYADFIKGKFHGISISRAGALSVAPRLDPVFAPGEAYIWSVASAADGSLYLGTGNRGRVMRVDPGGRGTTLWTAPEPEVFALAVDLHGAVYAGTSPRGKVYRIEGGKAQEYFDPKSAYIWALAVAKDGSLLVGTGNEGKIFRVTAPGAGEEYYATGQANITGLAFDREGRLLAGSEPNGILYRISGKDRAFVLYDSSLPEIRAMAVDAAGNVYAAGLGGSVAKKAGSAGAAGAAPASGLPVITTSITVVGDAAQNGGEIRPPTAPAPAASPSTVQAAASTATTTATAVAVDPNVEKSAIYKIAHENTVEALWSTKEENIYDLAVHGGDVLFSTDVSGRIYRLGADRRAALVAQASEPEAVRLLRSGAETLVVTGTAGRLYRLGDRAEGAGDYESPVYDAGSVARWGSLRWQGSGPVAVRTRSGNSLRPDRTWSDWSAPVSVAAGSAIKSPNARFLSWKAALPAGSTVESVSVGYLLQNNPPAVRSITVLTSVQAVAATVKGSPNSAAAATSPYTVTVSDTGDAGSAATSTGTPTQTLSRAGQQQLTISWQADDPDGDKLVYTLWFRGEEEREWKLLKGELHENTWTLDGDALADGRYLFRVAASDREANAGASAREAELVSSPVLIDNTPPVVTLRNVSLNGADVEAADAASALKRCEFAIDGGGWTPLEPIEGILDRRSGRFRIDLRGKLSAGEHVLVVRAVDSGNNAGLAKAILR